MPDDITEASWCLHCEHHRDNHEATGCSYQYDNDQAGDHGCGCLDFLSLRMVKAQAWDEGFSSAEKKENIERGYEMALLALGDRAPRPPIEDLEPRNPYA